MYQILIDGRDLYYPGDEEYTVTDAVVKLQLNDSGTFECGVPVQNPEYNNIKNRISMIQVLKNGKELFYGEVRESEKDFYGTKQVYAVGELAFLFDSIQPQAKFQDKTARQLLEIWLSEHNSQVEDKKKFYVGMVTVHDSNDSLYRFTNQETTPKGTAEPFKYDLQSSSEPWLWDSFNFHTGVIRTLKDIAINSTNRTVKILGAGIDTPPVFIVTQADNLKLTHGGRTYTLKVGRNRFPAVRVGKEDITLTFSGTGKLTVEYRGRYL